MAARLVCSLVAVLALFAPVSATNGRCPGGRFVVDHAALQVTEAPGVDAVVMDGTHVSIGGACGEAPAHVRRARGGMAVRARWKSCDGIPGPSA